MLAATFFQEGRRRKSTDVPPGPATASMLVGPVCLRRGRSSGDRRGPSVAELYLRLW